MYFMLQRDFFSKSSKCGLAHLSMMPSNYSIIISLSLYLICLKITDRIFYLLYTYQMSFRTLWRNKSSAYTKSEFMFDEKFVLFEMLTYAEDTFVLAKSEDEMQLLHMNTVMSENLQFMWWKLRLWYFLVAKWETYLNVWKLYNRGFWM